MGLIGHSSCGGGYNGFLIVMANIFRLNKKYSTTIAKGRLLYSLKEILCMVTTFILVILGWIIFRSDTVEQAMSIMRAILFHPFYNSALVQPRIALSSILIVIAVEWLQREKEHALRIDNIPFFNRRFVRWAAYYTIIAMILWFNGSSQTFIYFQF